MRSIIGISTIICLSACFFMTSCDDEKEATPPCDQYCYSMSDCYQVLDQPFSTSECSRNCYDNLERYTSVGCRNRYMDLLTCKTDLSCADANNVSEDCAPETEDLVQCIQ